jgi:hypothetical protein
MKKKISFKEIILWFLLGCASIKLGDLIEYLLISLL